MERNVQKRAYSCWILVEQAEDLPGVWVSHCLNFDIISQGDTPQVAVESLVEAVMMAMSDDLLEHHEPTERTPAPTEDWDRLRVTLEGARKVKLSEVPRDAKVRLATTLTFEATLMTVAVPATKSQPMIEARPPIVVAMHMPDPTYASATP